MTAERRYVVLGDEWWEHPSAGQHLFRCIARRRRVLWVDEAGGRRRTGSSSSGATGGAAGGAVQVLRSFAPPLPRLGVARRLAAAGLTRAVQRELGGSAGETVLVAAGERGADVLGRLGEAASVYYCDRALGAGPQDNGAARAEAELLKHVDLVVATAASLFERSAGRHARVRFLPPGVDWDAFRTGSGRAPAEICALPRPRIGYVGRVDARLDVAWLDAAAAALPDVTFLLVGPRRLPRGALDARANVRFAPAVSYADVPAVLHALDCGMLPYRTDGAAAVANPLQLREMLAAGIPVVSTALAEARRYAGHVRMAKDVDEWCAALRDALREGRTRADERSRAVRDETWERRAEEFERFVTEAVTAVRPTP